MFSFVSSYQLEIVSGRTPGKHGLLNSTAEAHGELTEAVATYTEVEQVWACWGPSSLNHKP